jgi:sialic acid synthase SpsE
MTHTLIIAEPGMTWDRKLDDAYRLIDAAKACGADVCKFQWTSSGRKIQERRKVDPKYIAIYEHGVQYPREWLELLKARCDSVGIEFACTTYLIEDIAVVAPLVKRFKVSAYESRWYEFVTAHTGKQIIVSCNDRNTAYNVRCHEGVRPILCVSEYPAKLEHLHLQDLLDHRDSESPYEGFSDHTADVLTGAAVAAMGKEIVEAHIRLHDTPESNPDYAHSLTADMPVAYYKRPFKTYVDNIREVERML